MRYWLFKSEPNSFSFDDLRAEPNQTTGWDGVRNYQARNFLRDDVHSGDLVLFYHSNAEPAVIAGIAEVVGEAEPDPTAFDPKSKYFDPKSNPDLPVWFQVAIRAVRSVNPPLSLHLLRSRPELAEMELLRKGSRLSVQPIRKNEWDAIMRLIDADTQSQPSQPRTLRKRSQGTK
ncbi:MAG: EVE domain-containing protein [Planctomycetota bacterium]|nr:EVE domain-containing protein [Planctomycetota bacterium]